MLFKRNLYKDLLEWKNDNFKRDFGSKMVLKLDGARQVGKTTLAILFGDENYETCTYINLLDSAEHRQDVQVFRDSFKNSSKSIVEICKDFNKNFEDNSNNLVIIDEIQEDVSVFNSIRNWARNLHCDVIVTGSYLGKANEPEYWLSAGDYVQLNLDVVSFDEFLEIYKLRDVYEKLDLYGESNSDEYDLLKKYYKLYCYIGGYPAVIAEYITKENLEVADRKLSYIFKIYCKESFRYLTDVEDRLIFNRIIRAIVHVLAKEKKGLDERSFTKELEKILSEYSTSNITQKEIRKALNWLIESRMIFPCDKAVNCNLLDIKYNIRYYMNDLGMARYLFKKHGVSNADTVGMLNELFVAKCIFNYKNGAFYEDESYPCFATLNDGELDFILRGKQDDKIYGVEVKAGNNKGITLYKALEEKKIDYAVSAKGDTFGGALIAEKKYTIPIYLFNKFKFDLGEKGNSLLPDIDI